MSISDSNLHVLLVEDDAIDIKYIKYGFSEYGIKNTLTVVGNGVEALDKIYGRNKVAKMDPSPKVIILDNNMPKMNGLEFLKILRSDPQFSALTVFILSSSGADRDMKAVQGLNVAGYFLKPLDFDAFLPLYKSIVDTF